MALKILNCFTNHEKLLLNYLMIISIAFEAKYKAKHRDGLKILTPTQMLQRLPIALSQVNELTNWNQTNYIYFVLGKRNN